MNIPEEAIEAAALASKRNWYPSVTEPCDDHRSDARAGLEAALPHLETALRKQIATEIRTHATTVIATHPLANVLSAHVTGIFAAADLAEEGVAK